MYMIIYSMESTDQLKGLTVKIVINTTNITDLSHYKLKLKLYYFKGRF